MVAYLKERAEEEMALRAKVEESKQAQMANEAKRHEDLYNILLQQQKQQQEFQQQQVQLNQEAMKQQQQQQFLQIQQSMANQQQQNFQMLMAILQKKKLNSSTIIFKNKLDLLHIYYILYFKIMCWNWEISMTSYDKDTWLYNIERGVYIHFDCFIISYKKKRGTVILLTFKTLFRHELYIYIVQEMDWISK